MIADTITERLGDCVLIPVPKGEKGPKIKAWQKLTLSGALCKAGWTEYWCPSWLCFQSSYLD